MDSKLLVLSLLFLVVVASGCGDGNGTEKESSRSVTVNSFQASQHNIYEDTGLLLSIEAENTGNLPAGVKPGENGTNILKNYCRDKFTIENFNCRYSGGDCNIGDDSLVMKPGYNMEMNWRMKQDGSIPIIGFQCPMRAELPFNYSVESYRQVQVKESKDVEGSPGLSSESSSGPLLLAIETVGSLTPGSETFIATEEGKENQRDMTVLVQLQNGQGEGYGKGVIDVWEGSFRINATEPLELSEGYKVKVEDSSDLEDECGVEKTEYGWTMNSGTEASCVEKYTENEWTVLGDYSEPRCDLTTTSEISLFEGKSQVIKCSVPVPEKDDLSRKSMISEITAEMDYLYLKDVGTRNIEVEPRGE